MKVGVGIIWEIVVDSKVDAFNINTTTEDISGNTDTFVELLELLISLDAVKTSVLKSRDDLKVHTALLD